MRRSKSQRAHRVQRYDERPETLIAAGGPVGAHVHHVYSRDIGGHDDYEEAPAEIDVMLPEPLRA